MLLAVLQALLEGFVTPTVDPLDEDDFPPPHVTSRS
jgi:hypothetical protein